jgi:LytS/YehU family sensor histidine kinase
MARNTTYPYWACQIAGWGGYSALGLTIATLTTGWHAGAAIGFALFFLYSIALTHWMRGVIRRRNWLAEPPKRGYPRIFGTAIAVGLLLASLVIGLSRLLAGQDVFNAAAMISTAGGLVFACWLWAGIYVGITRNRRSELREVELELTLGQAELRALQAQINPHFLFNSLNAIRGMIGEDPGRAQTMITLLAGLLRRALRATDAQTAPLGEEMDAVADYLELERTRFEERLRVTLDVEPAASGCAVPVMLLQTLVENAVRHGISNLPAGGTVRVRCGTELETVVVKVENTGILHSPDPHSTHTGLANARRRLRLIYGERASLSLSGGDNLVTATLIVPRIV